VPAALTKNPHRFSLKNDVSKLDINVYVISTRRSLETSKLLRRLAESRSIAGDDLPLPRDPFQYDIDSNSFSSPHRLPFKVPQQKRGGSPLFILKSHFC
jgi:hypothetical protein